MNDNSDSTERSPSELTFLAVGCLGLWTALTGMAMWNYWLAGAGALILLAMVCTFIFNEKD